MDSKKYGQENFSDILKCYPVEKFWQMTRLNLPLNKTYTTSGQNQFFIAFIALFLKEFLIKGFIL